MSDDPRVQAALAGLDGLDDAALAEHVSVLTEAQRRLHALLTDPATDGDPGGDARPAGEPT